jgi:hypothetical protein
LFDNSQFVAAADLNNEEPWQTLSEDAEAPMPLPYNSNRTVMELLYSDMAARIRCSVDIAELQQRSLRELISPVLFAAAALARTPGLRIAAEYAVTGERAHGSIDWVYLYQRLAVVACEVSQLLVANNLLAHAMSTVDIILYYSKLALSGVLRSYRLPLSYS